MMTITIIAIINNSNDDEYNNPPTASTAKSTKAAGCQVPGTGYQFNTNSRNNFIKNNKNEYLCLAWFLLRGTHNGACKACFTNWT